METTNEIIDKLKESVVIKLDELDPDNSYDQTLIDYILVMVVNQKSKYEMKHNLALFLGKISDDFVNWLFDYIPKLKNKSNTDPVKEESPSPKLIIEKKKEEEIKSKDKEHSKKVDKINETILNENQSSKANKKIDDIVKKESVNKHVNNKKLTTKKKKLKSAIVITDKSNKDENNSSDKKRHQRSDSPPLNNDCDDLDFEKDDDEEKDLIPKLKKQRTIITENNDIDADDDIDADYKKKVNRSVQVNETSNGIVVNNDDKQQTKELEEIQPKFLVTLDGVKNMFKVDDDIFLMDEELDPELMAEDCANADQLASIMNKKEKFNKDSTNKFERCRYWPACLNGKKCDYYHPVIKCNSFPHCRFGDKCLYIHPICKYDSICARKDCPFFHTTQKRLIPPIIPVTNNVVCKFYPNCVNPVCEFLHPKSCHFGAACKTFNCPFNHPNQNLPHPSKLKWTNSAN